MSDGRSETKKAARELIIAIESDRALGAVVMYLDVDGVHVHVGADTGTTTLALLGALEIARQTGLGQLQGKPLRRIN